MTSREQNLSHPNGDHSCSCILVILSYLLLGYGGIMFSGNDMKIEILLTFSFWWQKPVPFMKNREAKNCDDVISSEIQPGKNL